MRKRLCEVKEKMIDVVMAQMDHLETVNVCELGEAIDIIKDIAEAEYYCSVVKAMDEKAVPSTNAAHETRNVSHYLHTLADDIHRMMDTMSPEERMMTRDKLHELYQLM